MSTDKDHDLTSTDQPSEAPDPGSSEPLDAPNSLSDAQVAQVLDHPDFANRIEAEAEKKAQSVKDKRFNKLDNQQKEILAKMKLTPEQQEQYEKLDTAARIDTLEKLAASGTEGPASPEPQTTFSIRSVFEEHGYEMASLTPELTLLGSTPGMTKDQLDNELFKLGKSQPKTETTGAAVIQESGGGAPKALEGAGLQDKYATEMLAARGKPEEIRAIKADYKERGLDVDNIVVGQGAEVKHN